jgi:primosomal protein N' (replication factor Y)
VYPPYTRLANVIVSGIEEEPVAQLTIDAAAWLRRLIAEQRVEGVTVVGPAPCPVERVKRRWRWHLLLKSENPAALTKVARYFLEKFDVPARGEMRVSVDRDPVALL